MIKIIMSLLWNMGSIKDWQLQIGAYLLEKGCGYKLGQIVREKKLANDRKEIYRVKVVTNMFYDFSKKEVTHIKQNRIIKPGDITKI